MYKLNSINALTSSWTQNWMTSIPAGTEQIASARRASEKMREIKHNNSSPSSSTSG